MTLEQQVIPLPMAQRLKELGVKQESLFVHDEYPFDPGNSAIRLKETETHLYWNCPSAFTVAELGQLLPDFFTVDHYRMHFRSYKQEQYKKPALWTCTFGHSTDKEVPDFDRHNEAEARGALLIHLLESNLITIEEVNSRI